MVSHRVSKITRSLDIPAAKAQVKAAHLAQIDGIAMAVQDGEAGVGGALDEHAGDAVAAGCPCVEHLQVLLLSITVLPLRLVCEVQLLLVPRLILILSEVNNEHLTAQYFGHV